MNRLHDRTIHPDRRTCWDGRRDARPDLPPVCGRPSAVPATRANHRVAAAERCPAFLGNHAWRALGALDVIGAGIEWTPC